MVERLPLEHSGIVTLLDRLAAIGGAEPRLIGLAGAQGSGKSTLARAYARAHPGALAFSLDDFYLTARARAGLAECVHPLLRTRGVPGTHDLALLGRTLDALHHAAPDESTPIPVFDKLADDRLPLGEWRSFAGRPSLILVEGWCLGALPESEAALAEPVNALERERDSDGRWRRYVNAQLAGQYAALFARFGAIAFLRAPGIDQVVLWRQEQQETLLGRALAPAEAEQIAGFVAHFERITRHMIAGGVRADLVADLAPDRSVRG